MRTYEQDTTNCRDLFLGVVTKISGGFTYVGCSPKSLKKSGVCVCERERESVCVCVCVCVYVCASARVLMQVCMHV